MAELLAPHPAPILLVNDRPPIWCFLAGLLYDGPDVIVVGHALTSADAIRLAREQEPDLFVLNCYLRDLSATPIVRGIRAILSDVRVLAYAAFDHGAPARELVHLGVRGWRSKRAGGTAVVAGLRAILAICWVLDADVLEALGFDTGARTVTAREHDVLELVATGFADAEVATALKIALPTIGTHMVRVLSNLGARSRGDDVRIAQDLGLSASPPRGALQPSPAGRQQLRLDKPVHSGDPLRNTGGKGPESRLL